MREYTKPTPAAFVVAVRINGSEIECLMIKQKKTKEGEKPWGFPGGKKKVVEKRINYSLIAQRRAEEKTGLLFPDLAGAEILFQRGYFPVCFLFYLEEGLREPNIPIQAKKVIEVKWFSLDKVRFLPRKRTHKKAYRELKSHLKELARSNETIKNALSF